MVSLWLSLLLAAPLANAFSDTSPVVAWSSSPSSVLAAISRDNQLVMNSVDVLGTMLTEDICSYEAVIVVEQPGLHASDLRTLSSNSYLAKQLHSAPSSVHVPYTTPASPVGLGRSIAKLCNTNVVELGLGQDVESLLLSGKQVIHIDLPELESVGQERREEMREAEEKLSNLLTKLDDAFPSHFVIITGTTPSSFSNMKRHVAQSLANLPAAFRSPRASSSSSNGVKPLPSSGIFHRYQLLTHGLITTIGITFLLILPFVLMVIGAVAGIKSPLRSEGFKQSQDKKNQ